MGALLLCLAWNYASFLETVPYCHRPYILGWDSNGYFAWGRSLAVDGDIDFRNDFSFLARMGGFGPTQAHFSEFLRGEKGELRTPIGRIANKYGLGMGLISLPLLYVARLLSYMWEHLTPLRISPFAAAYPLAFIFSSILVGFAGIAASFRILRERYGATTSLIAILCGLLGLNLGYYIWFDPTMAHGVSFACNTLFVASALGWVRLFERSVGGGRMTKAWAGALAMGSILGFSCTVRYTNAAFSLVPLVLVLDAWREHGRERTGAWVARAIQCLIAATAGTMLGFLPQIIAWKSLYGSFLVYSYSGEAIYLFPVHLWRILFGSVNSLFIWTPLAAIACIGLGMAAARAGGLAAAAIAVLVAELWIYGGWDWYSLEYSFGMRGLVDCSFVFLLGLAEIVHRLRTTRWAVWWRASVALLISALVLWNLYFLVACRAGIQPGVEPFAGRNLFSRPDRWLEQARRDLTVFWAPKYSVFTLSDPFDEGP
ncbi:hypothetical protein JW916_09260 [Candidatus Sumerlaeota bacterium]|nr:hypothetical protein [Candidatus Sumerlaeota bacterium]